MNPKKIAALTLVLFASSIVFNISHAVTYAWRYYTPEQTDNDQAKFIKNVKQIAKKKKLGAQPCYNGHPAPLMYQASSSLTGLAKDTNNYRWASKEETLKKAQEIQEILEKAEDPKKIPRWELPILEYSINPCPPEKTERLTYPQILERQQKLDKQNN